MSGCEIKVEFNDGHIEYCDALHLNDYYSGTYCERLNWQTSVYNTKTGEIYSVEDFKNLIPGKYEIRFICDSEYHEASTVYTSVEVKIAPYTGDVNLDGSIDICDATLIQYFIAENIYDEGVSAYGDFDGDGQITVTDVTALQKYLVGITA